MFKKLASLLFEEEEEVIEEEIDSKDKVNKSERVPISQNLKDKPAKLERSLIASMNPKPVNDVQEEVIVQDETIEIEHEAVEDIIKPVKPEFGIAFSDPLISKEKPKVLKEKPIYEFNPVISPMFGVSESKRSQPIKHSVNPPQSVKRSRINTVISPIYGDIENKKAPVTTSTHVFQKPFKHDSFIDVENHELPKFKTENYSLDDLLSPIKPQDEIVPVHISLKEDDDELAHQFSLFDEIK